MGGWAFWVFWGIILGLLIWTRSNVRIEKQRTLQRLLERNEEIDEDLVNRLIGMKEPRKPGANYRFLRAFGAFVMAASVPMAVLVGVIAGGPEEPALIVAAAILTGCLVTFCLGLGLFLSSRFCEKPLENSDSA